MSLGMKVQIRQASGGQDFRSLQDMIACHADMRMFYSDGQATRTTSSGAT